MAAVNSEMLPLGTRAPDFTLPDTEGNTVSLDDLGSPKVYVVAFICNHCPFVKHIAAGLAQLGRDYAGEEVAIVAISSNDADAYPQDGLEAMAVEKREREYVFPYLYDESQSVAKAYHAACTPDFFVFDSERKLAYRGQLDDSRPDNGIEVTGADLRAAIDATRKGEPVRREQKPSIGCNIKWKPGNEPEYFG